MGFFGSLLLRAVSWTLRWELVGLKEEDGQWWANQKPCILIFWHGRQLFMPWIYLNRQKSKNAPRMAVLISEHNDGRMIAAGMRFFGVDSVAGSSSRGGLRALHLLIKKLENYSHVGMTPDGPKGPPQKLKTGVLVIAQRSGAAIHPAAFAAERYWRFKSWDSMIFPKPFSRAVLIKGSPILVPQCDTEEQMAEASSRVENALNEVTKRADEYFHQPASAAAPHAA